MWTVTVTGLHTIGPLAYPESTGRGVSVAPPSAMLTTQQAADYPGISRRTMVRILERGEIPMESAFPEAAVNDYEVLVSAMTCHPKDRLVLAAGVEAPCRVLVTSNLRDFPDSSTQPHHIDAVTPGAFLLDVYPARVA